MKYIWLMLFALPGLAQELIELPNPDSRHVDIMLRFYTGGVDDPKGEEGLTYLTARNLVESGTKSLSKAEIDVLLYPMAARFSLIVGKEATTLYTTLHVDHVAQVYPIFRDLLAAPRFDASDFSRVKENALKAVTRDIPDNNDEVLSKRVLDTLMYENHPYGHLIQGTKGSLEKLDLAKVKAHFAGVFCRSRLKIGLAGNYSKDLAARIVADMAALPEGKTRGKIAQVPMPTGVVARIVKKERAFGSAIFMGFPLAVDRASDDFAAMLVVASYFGEHRNSYGRLYSELRSKRSLNYGDYAYVEWYQSGHARMLPAFGHPRSINAFNMWIRPVQIAEQFADIEGLAQPDLGNGVYAIRKAIRELELLLEKGISEADFALSRQFMSGYLRHYVQSQTDRLGFLMDGRAYGRKDYIEEMIGLLGKLTVEDVNRVMRKYLQAKNIYLSVITDDSEADKMAKALKNNASAPIVYKPVVRAGLTADILADDKKTDAYGLNVKHLEIVDVKDLFQ